MAIERASGNIFEDLGFDAEEARSLKRKADIAIALEKIIQAKHLNKTQAADLFGIPRVRLNKLLSGDYRDISLDKMLGMVERAGQRVEIKIVRRVHVVASRKRSHAG